MSEFFDLRILRGSRTRIVLDNGKLEEISQAPFQGAAVRALSGGGWGFVTTDKVDGLDDKIELAKRIAKKIRRDDCLKLAEAPSGKSVHVGVKKNPQVITGRESRSFEGDRECCKNRRHFLYPSSLFRNGAEHPLSQL